MGFLLVNKPKDWTSHDVVAFLRGKIKEGNPGSQKIKIGHAGTLDPFATGLLIVGVGRESTSRLDDYKNLPKTYIATLKLGEVSDTYDITGKITPLHPSVRPTKRQIIQALNLFAGEQKQTPPMFSAKKIGGHKLYELARRGKTVPRQPATINIYEIGLLDYAWPYLKIKVQCSAGTYIRSLANDIGDRLGTGALCSELTRTEIGRYNLNNAITPDNFNSIIYDKNPGGVGNRSD